MSARANPTAIGAFLVGALAVGVGAVALLGSMSWFESRSTFVGFFAESINGLVIGAPVKFQGVPVGTVTDLMIQIDRQGKTFRVPVRFNVDLTKLRTMRGSFVDLADSAVRDQQIADGLRVQLQLESMVTGQLYLELSYNAGAAPPVLEGNATPWPEIPTKPSLMAALGTGAGSVVADVLKVLYRVNVLLGDIDMPKINSAVVASAQAIQRLAGAPEIRAALRELPIATAQVTRTMVAMEKLAVTTEGAVGPVAAQAERATTELASALKVLRRTLEETAGLLSMDAGIGYEMQAALASVREAADAMQLLTATIEQSPDILLRGKRPPEKKP